MVAKRIHISDLPAWPRLLNQAQAAAYCGSSPTHFDTHIAPHLTKLKFGRSSRYDKHEIDKFIDKMLLNKNGYADPKEALEALN